ncbi:hypothetical protein HELRODRAFT_179053 [Helobdella robusta]|uniref:Uncharacterized protein n=1 Tax=Helobdella robusta TaxID=6412 RepID=T1FE41_HELRO|nr:hypothetical protein HELRODRAFT_179053 [Helobdella robusta]ESN95860.1 hypothetical protein HELRODRAFT_179053 [Helobdella robusta]
MKQFTLEGKNIGRFTTERMFAFSPAFYNITDFRTEAVTTTLSRKLLVCTFEKDLAGGFLKSAKSLQKSIVVKYGLAKTVITTLTRKSMSTKDSLLLHIHQVDERDKDKNYEDDENEEDDDNEMAKNGDGA